MARVKPDFSFEREGRPLHAWLPELVAPDAAVRTRAGDAVGAMFYGLPSVHTDLADIEGGMPTGEAHAEAWRAAVREAVSRPAFPRRPFFAAAAARLIGLQAEWMRQVTAVDEQYERLLARLETKRDAARTEEERRNLSRRIGRAVRASCDREDKRQQPSAEAAFSMGTFALGWVIENAGPALLEAPEAIWMLLDTRGQEYLGLKAIERIGPPAIAEFGDWLLEGFDAGRPNETSVIAAVLGEDPRLHQRLLAALVSAANDPPLDAAVDPQAESFHATFYAPRIWSAAAVLAQLGAAVRRAPGIGERFLPALMGLTRSPRPGHRAAAAMALPGVTRGANAQEARIVLDRLLEMTHDQSWVAGRAIVALGALRAAPDVVVPRLIDLFDAFEEFDPDEGYGGEHARVCRALAAFGPDGASAVPRLVDELRRSIAAEPDTVPKDLVSALGAIGPAAATALPDLERIAARRREYEDESDSPLQTAIARIRAAG